MNQNSLTSSFDFRPTPHVRDFKQYIDPDSNWCRLAGERRQLDPFSCGPHWQLAYHETKSPHRNLYIFPEQDGFLAFADNHFDDGRMVLVPLEVEWGFSCPVLGKKGVDLLADSLAVIREQWPDRQVDFAVGGLRDGGVLYQELLKRFGGDHKAYVYREELMVRASLLDGLDGYLSRRSRNFRKNLRKAVSKACEMGITFERHVPNTQEQVLDIYARMADVEVRSWKGNWRGFVGGWTEKFYLKLLEFLSSKTMARVMFARHEGNDIGYIFGGLLGQHYRGQQFSFDEEWGRFGIGNMMQLRQIEWLCEEGIRHYDMGPWMEYKTHWTEQHANMKMLVFSSVT